MAQALAATALLAGSPVLAQDTVENGTTDTAGVMRFFSLRAEGLAAAAADDLVGARALFAEADSLIPNHPGLTLMRAQVAMADEDPVEAVTMLRNYAAAGLALSPAAAERYAGLGETPGYFDAMAQIEANRAPVGAERTVRVAEITGSALVESVARDEARGRWLVSQVRGLTIVALSDDGATSPFLDASEGVAGVLGLAVDNARGILWAAASPVPPAAYGATEPLPGPELLKIELASGRIAARYAGPVDDREHSFGDVALGVDGSVFVADSSSGEIYQLRPGAGSLELLLPSGTLRSPQGMVMTPDGQALIAADYSSGLYRVNLASGTAARLPAPESSSLIGIDGLVAGQDAIYALQNGVAPQRVLRLTPSADWSSLTDARPIAANLADIEEPTTGVIHDDDLVYVSRSQWRAFGAEGAPTTDTPTPTVVSRLRL